MRPVHWSAPLKTLRTATAYSVAAAIAEAREAAGLKQRDLATLLRWDHSVIGAIESKGRQVKVPEFVAIADAIGVEATDLLARVLRLGPQRTGVRTLYRSRRRELLARQRPRPQRGRSREI